MEKRRWEQSKRESSESKAHRQYNMALKRHATIFLHPHHTIDRVRLLSFYRQWSLSRLSLLHARAPCRPPPTGPPTRPFQTYQMGL